MLHTIFDVPREPGLSEVLNGQTALDEGLRQITVGADSVLDLLPTGTLPPNPAELLGSKRMRALLRELEDRYKAVILDSPPLTVVTDAAVLGTKAEGVILVARAAVTSEGALPYSVDQLNSIRASVVGVVLNDLDFKRDGRYGSAYGQYDYYYKSYYGIRGEGTR